MKLICLTSLALLVATIQVARTAAIDSYAGNTLDKRIFKSV